jgi:hypothetical protein
MIGLLSLCQLMLLCLDVSGFVRLGQLGQVKKLRPG